MINSKPRFAVNDDGSIHDYQHHADHPPHGLLYDRQGAWNLVLLQKLIMEDKHIEAAFQAGVTPQEDKVEQANASFMADETATATPEHEPSTELANEAETGTDANGSPAA